MSLRLTDVRRIAREVTRDQFPGLEIVGAVAKGDSGYTEVLMTVRGCRQEPCQIMIGLNRDTSESEFRKAIHERLREHVDEHRIKA